jgi:hypothetical protein
VSKLAQAGREAKLFARFTGSLPGFLRGGAEIEQTRAKFEERMRTRESAFISTLRRTVYEQPRSPYLALLRHANLELDDVAKLVEEHGLEGALAELYDAGVYVTTDEAKGYRPIERNGLTLQASPEDFDNPISGRHLRARSGGSSGEARAMVADLASLAAMGDDSALTAPMLGRADVTCLCMPPPPGSGLTAALIISRTGHRLDRWYLTTEPDLQAWLLMATAWLACRTVGTRSAWPRRGAGDEASEVAQWIAEHRRAGRYPAVTCTPSLGVRICNAAQQAGLSIEGTIFFFGSEPYTAGKAEIVEQSGCRGFSHYGMTELGWLGYACDNPLAFDDVHLAIDRVAVLERPRPVGGSEVDVMFFTNLLPGSPKIALNFESGDYGALEHRDCGCPLSELGLDLHLRTIRSHEKLTSEGVTFFGEELVRLLEQTMPARFGGGPTDYQIVEAEREGQTVLRLLVSPRLGPLDEDELRAVVLDALGNGGRGHAHMAKVLRDQARLEVVRDEPKETVAGKMLPLHMERRIERERAV